MIPKISKILYATDLSLNAAYVFRYALSTAEKHNATIDVLYAIEPAGVMGFGAKFGSPEVDAKAIARKIKKRIEALVEGENKDKASLMKRVSAIQVTEGDPAAVILQAVEDTKPDILIMGTHGKGIIAHTFLGSVAQKVLQRIRIPVYVIPIPELSSDYVKWLKKQQKK